MANENNRKKNLFVENLWASYCRVTLFILLTISTSFIFYSTHGTNKAIEA